jgi:hypothetical protein
MIKLPESTYIGKKIPKEEFYKNLSLSTAVKKAFIDDVEQIIWQNVLSPATLNVGNGQKVNQVDVVMIVLKRKEYSKAIIDVIEKAIPRHLIFLFKYLDNFQLYVNFKEEYQKGKFKIIDTYAADWMKEDELDLSIKGLDIDQVYENLVFQIAGSRIEKQEGVDLKQSVQQAQEIEKIKRKIAELENKKLNEKQFNIQLKISNEIKELKNKLNEQYEPRHN